MLCDGQLGHGHFPNLPCSSLAKRITLKWLHSPILVKGSFAQSLIFKPYTFSKFAIEFIPSMIDTEAMSFPQFAIELIPFALDTEAMFIFQICHRLYSNSD